MSNIFFPRRRHTTVLFLNPETHERLTDATRLCSALVKAVGGEVYEGEYRASEKGWHTLDGRPLTVVYNCGNESETTQEFTPHAWREVSDKMGAMERPISLEEFILSIASQVKRVEAPTDPASVYLKDSRNRFGFDFPSFAYALLRSLKTYEETLAFHESV